MEKPFELAYTELKKGCFPEELSFRTTAEIKPLEGVHWAGKSREGI